MHSNSTEPAKYIPTVFIIIQRKRKYPKLQTANFIFKHNLNIKKGSYAKLELNNITTLGNEEGQNSQHETFIGEGSRTRVHGVLLFELLSKSLQSKIKHK